HVESYANGIGDIIEQESLINLRVFNLEAYFGNIAFDTMRSQLEIQFAEPLAQLKARTKTSLADNALFNGIHRFIYEDQKQLLSPLSNNQIKIQTKAIAYQVIRRSNAWSRLISEKFPDAIRFSIHP